MSFNRALLIREINRIVKIDHDHRAPLKASNIENHNNWYAND